MALKTPWFDLQGLSQNDNDKLRRFFEQVDEELTVVAAGGGGGTSYPILYPSDATFPDASGSGNSPATLETVVAGAAVVGNVPKVTYVQALFDPSTDEHLLWAFPLPTTFTDTLTFTLYWGAKVTTGNVVWKVSVSGGVSGNPAIFDFGGASFQIPVLSAAVAVPPSVGRFTTTEITITPFLGVAGKPFIVMVGRDADNGSDTASGDATLLCVEVA